MLCRRLPRLFEHGRVAFAVCKGREHERLPPKRHGCRVNHLSLPQTQFSNNSVCTTQTHHKTITKQNKCVADWRLFVSAFFLFVCACVSCLPHCISRNNTFQLPTSSTCTHAHARTHAHTHSLTHPLTSSLTSSLTPSLTPSLPHSFTPSLTHSTQEKLLFGIV